MKPIIRLLSSEERNEAVHQDTATIRWFRRQVVTSRRVSSASTQEVKCRWNPESQKCAALPHALIAPRGADRNKIIARREKRITHTKLPKMADNEVNMTRAVDEPLFFLCMEHDGDCTYAGFGSSHEDAGSVCWIHAHALPFTQFAPYSRTGVEVAAKKEHTTMTRGTMAKGSVW